MTTDRLSRDRGRGPVPALQAVDLRTEGAGPRASPLEWKLGVTLGLTLVYLCSWWGLALSLPAAEPSAPLQASELPVSGRPRALWLEQLPVAERPLLQPPAGWTLASTVEPADAPAPRIVRVSPPRRMRTRSS